ncbi:MAG: molybdopterin-binding protein [Caldilinea sp.]|nr:molybdopterin-binding protein [Caldilinea sp.]MDW8439018.1 molybdopterin-binding protein [Caldilineaceae bacterium]
MTSIVKTGVLCIPTYDEQAVQAVHRLLHARLRGVVVWAERHGAGQRYWVEELLRRWCDEEELDLILTIGGTAPAPGPSAWEITPEATAAVIERLLPGLPEAMRAAMSKKTPLAFLDRSMAGIRGRTVILNLPAGVHAVSLALEAVVDLLGAALAHVRQEPVIPTLEDALATVASLDDGEDDEPMQPPSTLSTPAGAGKRPGRSLDPEEFAEFLRRRSREQ